MKKVLIVGAGLSGCICANLLAKKHYNIDIIEKNNFIGGICFDYLSDDKSCYIHQFGPHVFHTKNEEIYKFIQQFDSFINYHHIVFAQHDNQLYNFPINLNTISQVFNCNVYSKEDADKIIHDCYFQHPSNFQQIALNNVGTKLYEMFIKNYTLKQWKIDPSKLSVDIFKRVNIRYNYNNDYFENQFQGVPQHGYTNLIKNMINDKNINLILNQDFDSFKYKQKYDCIIYTGNIKNLPYRSTEFIHYIDKKSNLPALNVPQDKQFTRITNFNVLSKVTDNNSYHHFLKEKPVNNNELNQLYPITTKQNLDLYKIQADKMKSLYPNMMFCGRLATYQYLDMDIAVKKAIDLIENNF